MQYVYFHNIDTVDELKKEYHRLCMMLHPDRGGSTEKMQVLNAEYDALYATVKDTHRNRAGEIYERRTDEAPEAFRDLMDALLKLNRIHIAVIGSFLWVSGDTRPHRHRLKELGLKWHQKKGCWYLSPKGYRRSGDREYSMADIRSMYGVQYEDDVRQAELAG